MTGRAYLRATELALMNAPFEQDGWRKAIAMVAHATGSESANLVALGGPLLLPLNMFVGRESEMAEDYFGRPELWGSCNWRVNSAGAPMTVQHEAHYAATRSRGGTTAYDDAVADLDMQFGCQSPLISDERNFLGLAILRGRREGPCDDVALQRFGHLIRQVHRAVRVQLALDGEAAELMLGEIATMHCRVVLIDRHGCLAALTPPAEELLEEQGPARLTGLQVRLRHRDEDRRLHRAVARLLSADDPRGPVVHEMRAGRTAEFPHGRWRLSAVRLPRCDRGLGFEAEIALTFHPLAA